MSSLYLQNYVQEVIGSFVVYWLFWWIIVYFCLNMATKSEKDKQKALHDKNQMILSGLLRDDDNKYCVDCDAKGWTLLFADNTLIQFRRSGKTTIIIHSLNSAGLLEEFAYPHIPIFLNFRGSSELPNLGPNLENFVKCTYENVTRELRIVS